jgi:hypothetical protein
VQNNELTLQKTLDARPWMLGCALSFSKNENPREKYTAVTRIQQSAENRDVERDALLLHSTIDHRRSSYNSKMKAALARRGGWLVGGERRRSMIGGRVEREIGVRRTRSHLISHHRLACGWSWFVLWSVCCVDRS